MEKIAQKSCVDFIEVLASKAAVPGGGGAAAADLPHRLSGGYFASGQAQALRPEADGAL